MIRMKGWKIDKDLAGACGLASILLSIAIGDVEILRSRCDHAWAEVDGVIIDITATQFNKRRNKRHPKCKNGTVSGVLITKVPKTYHLDVISHGLLTYLSIVNGNWYNEKDHPRWRWISEYWL